MSDELDSAIAKMNAFAAREMQRMGLGGGREPRKRIWWTPGGWQIGWTTERTGGHKSESKTAGRFAAFVYKPEGPGSMSGRKALDEAMRKRTVRYRLVKQTYRVSRKSAKRQALAWLKARLKAEAESTLPFAAESTRMLESYKHTEVVGRGRLEWVEPKEV